MSFDDMSVQLHKRGTPETNIESYVQVHVPSGLYDQVQRYIAAHVSFTELHPPKANPFVGFLVWSAVVMLIIGILVALYLQVAVSFFRR